MSRTNQLFLLSGFLAAAGSWVLALFIHQSFYLGMAGLLLCCSGILLANLKPREFGDLCGLSRCKNYFSVWMIIGLLLGILLGCFYAAAYDTPFFPASLSLIALPAAAIGITEEILFRGFIQGVFSSRSGWLGIVAGTSAHSLYKLFVIAANPVGQAVNLTVLFSFTFLFGLLAGFIRMRSGSIWPAALAHAVFDIMVYGGDAQLPAWVWG